MTGTEVVIADVPDLDVDRVVLEVRLSVEVKLPVEDTIDEVAEFDAEVLIVEVLLFETVLLTDELDRVAVLIVVFLVCVDVDPRWIELDGEPDVVTAPDDVVVGYGGP